MIAFAYTAPLLSGKETGTWFGLSDAVNLTREGVDCFL